MGAMKLLLPFLLLLCALSPKQAQFKAESGKPMQKLIVVIPKMVTNTITLSWDYPDDPKGIDGVNLYVSTNLVDWEYLGAVRMDDYNPTNMRATFVDEKRVRARYFQAKSFAGADESEGSNIARYPGWPPLFTGYLLAWLVPATAELQSTIEFDGPWNFEADVTGKTNYFVAYTPEPQRFYRLSGTAQPLTISTVYVPDKRNLTR
jgi:hypothetical protein